MRNLITILFIAFLGFYSNAQMVCPDDVLISCDADIWPENTGEATVYGGNYSQSMLNFSDTESLNSCNNGNIFRKWFIDANYNNIHESIEPSCIQTITLESDDHNTNPQFPTDREYSCTDDISLDEPTWSPHPCHQISYTYEDQEFNFSGGACKKILRTFTLINWCTYDESTGAGIWHHTQAIKIIDNEAPEITSCEDQYYDASINCEGEVTLTNAVTETGDCPSTLIAWTLSVDLWGDGTEDLFFGPNEPAPFKIDPQDIDAEIEITLPELVGIGDHKAQWSASDGCGNVRSCNFKFFVEDNKPPTPYCLGHLGATLNGEDGWVLNVPAEIFVVDALDNCSKKEDIRFSFSENVDDNIRVVECGETGFNFFRIYFTDEAGNQDFCEVFMLIFDNGSCFGKYAPEGKILKPDGTAIMGATALLMEDEEYISERHSDNEGHFSFGEQDLMDTYFAKIAYTDDGYSSIDIEDYLLLQRGLIGLESFNFYQKLASDVNGDNEFGIADLKYFRDYMLGDVDEMQGESWSFVPKYLDFNIETNKLDFENTIPYMKYGSGFDFIGIKRGDVSGATLTSEDEAEELQMEIEIEDGVVHISNLNEFIVDGISINSTSMLENGMLTQAANGKFINIEYKNILESNELYFSIQGEFEKASVEDIIAILKSSINIYPHKSTSAAKLIFKVDDYREDKLDEKMIGQIGPNPFKDQVLIYGNDIKSVQMFTFEGAEIAVEVEYSSKKVLVNNLENLTSGIYIISARINGETQSFIIVK